MPVPGRNERFFEVIRGIPRGRVATYGQVAELAGVTRGHRWVAAALRTCPAGTPWHRVVAKHGPRHGRIAIPDGELALRQRRLLERERVRFDDRDRIALLDFGWLPLDLF